MILGTAAALATSALISYGLVAGDWLTLSAGTAVWLLTVGAPVFLADPRRPDLELYAMAVSLIGFVTGVILA